MLKNGNGVQMWVQPDTREAYKAIGAITGESQAQAAARLAQQELKKQERKAGKGGARS